MQLGVRLQFDILTTRRDDKHPQRPKVSPGPVSNQDLSAAGLFSKTQSTPSFVPSLSINPNPPSPPPRFPISPGELPDLTAALSPTPPLFLGTRFVVTGWETSELVLLPSLGTPFSPPYPSYFSSFNFSYGAVEWYAPVGISYLESAGSGSLTT